MTVLSVRKNHQPVIVDVREPAEFDDLHLYGAINIPSTTYQISDFEGYRQRPIYLVCNTGQRLKGVKKRLEAAGFNQVHVNSIQMQAYTEQQQQNPGIEGSWTVDRQFRLMLGVIMLLTLAGLRAGISSLIAIILIIALGMTITAIIDRCYLKMLVAWMPWNRK